jgi:hypothetical protein
MTTPPPAPDEPGCRWLPWRNATLGWLTTAVILAVGLPPFLRMPLWCDATLYEVAARNVLQGGVHYKDVFDTNPPGFVWLMCAVFAAFGHWPEALRAVDLVVVGAVTVLLLRWARAAGASRAAVAWSAAGIASFYPFISEFCHVQRDAWMMLPAILAVRYRMRRIERACSRPVTDGWVFRTGFLEGVLWSLAFWIKPHIGLPAAAVWFAVAARFGGTSARPRRRLAADLGGVLSAVVVVVALGVAWMVGTGAWEWYLDVNRNWNTGYLRVIFGELGGRVLTHGIYFPPWSVLFVVAVPVAVMNLIDARVWSSRPTDGPDRRWPDWLYAPAADDRTRFARAVLAALYLGWSLTMMIFQRNFHYVYVPETLMMIALFAANRWAAAFLAMAFHVAFTVYVLAHQDDPAWLKEYERRRDKDVIYWHLPGKHPALDRARLKLWEDCFARHLPRKVRRDLGFQTEHFGGLDPVQLGDVEDFLRGQGVKDREVICWHNSPHELYLSLGVKPPLRFMHVGTVQEMGEWRPTEENWYYRQIRRETFEAAKGARFVVSDMHRVTWHYTRLNEVDPQGLPVALPAWQRAHFPFNQPVVFRSSEGRYLVHQIRRPVEEWDCKIPVNPDDPASRLTRAPHASATTGLCSTPIPSISTSATSPGLSSTGGLRAMPTPGGVPVKIRSPG